MFFFLFYAFSEWIDGDAKCCSYCSLVTVLFVVDTTTTTFAVAAATAAVANDGIF